MQASFSCPRPVLPVSLQGHLQGHSASSSLHELPLPQPSCVFSAHDTVALQDAAGMTSLAVQVQHYASAALADCACPCCAAAVIYQPHAPVTNSDVVHWRTSCLLCRAARGVVKMHYVLEACVIQRLSLVQSTAGTAPVVSHKSHVLQQPAAAREGRSRAGPIFPHDRCSAPTFGRAILWGRLP